jgi:hypothetical protein
VWCMHETSGGVVIMQTSLFVLECKGKVIPVL